MKPELFWQIKESVRGLAEAFTQLHRHLRRDGALSQDDLVDGAGRNTEGATQGALRNSERDQILFQQDYARVDGSPAVVFPTGLEGSVHDRGVWEPKPWHSAGRT
jgi:hypothetical protein